LDIEDVIKILKSNKKVDFILTGRDKFKKINELSDLVSEIINVKHPFDLGKKAKRGIDY